MTRHLQIDADVVAEDDVRFVSRLAQAYLLRQRPLCLCRPTGIPMYVARIRGGLVAKRMPLTGKDHHPACSSFEPADDPAVFRARLSPATCSQKPGQSTAIDAAFALSKGRISPSNGARSHRGDRRKESRTRFSLLALLHLLWHTSGLTEWTGYWIGKRRWWHVHRHLVEAAHGVSILGEPLSQRVLIPEPFKIEDKLAIESRRSHTIARFSGHASNQRMLLIGEIKQFRDARDGPEIIVKHMPGLRLLLDGGQMRRLQRGFGGPLSLWRSDKSLHLIAIATAEVATAGALRVAEIAVMTVTQYWLPVENAHDLQLVMSLARTPSKMVKGLSFDSPGAQPFATVTLPDARPTPWALYLVPADAGGDYETRLALSIVAHTDTRAWIWRLRDGDMPPLPNISVERASAFGEGD